MRDDVNKQRGTWRTVTAAALTGLAVLAAATGALAHDGEGRGWKHHGRYFVPPGHVYYAPAAYYAPRYYYAPRPAVVYPASGYYEPAPVYYPPPGLTINVPLR